MAETRAKRPKPTRKTIAALRKAIDFFGSGAELARVIGVSKQLVYDWKAEKYAVSLRCAILIEKETDSRIKAKELIPDLIL